MNTGKPNLQTMGKYALCQLPGALIAGGILFFLHRSFGFPGWLAWTLFGIWVLKDVLLFPFVWTAYSTEAPGAAMTGRVGETRGRLEPDGYIRVGGELWWAELPPGAPAVDDGERVKVLGQRGLTLIVERADPEDAG